jgi:hypothetical protein
MICKVFLFPCLGAHKITRAAGQSAYLVAARFNAGGRIGQTDRDTLCRKIQAFHESDLGVVSYYSDLDVGSKHRREHADRVFIRRFIKYYCNVVKPMAVEINWE